MQTRDSAVLSKYFNNLISIRFVNSEKRIIGITFEVAPGVWDHKIRTYPLPKNMFWENCFWLSTVHIVNTSFQPLLLQFGPL